MKIQLKLTHSIYKQIQHLLGLYPKTEWSGVGFYKKLETNKRNWTTKWELITFFPLDLGSTAATEFSGEDEIKFLDKAYKKFPELRECYRGLIHSHHSLGGGAFFSRTDEEHLEECANQVGYPSLVVALQETGSPFAFAVSWEDQFGKINMTKAKDARIIIDVPDYKPISLFKDCIESLKKQEKEAKTVKTYNGFGVNMGYLRHPKQIGLFQNNMHKVVEEKHKSEIFEYDDNIKDRKYQKLLNAYKIAEENWMSATVGSPNYELIEQSAIDTEMELDNYCIEKGFNQEEGGWL